MNFIIDTPDNSSFVNSPTGMQGEGCKIQSVEIILKPQNINIITYSSDEWVTENTITLDAQSYIALNKTCNQNLVDIPIMISKNLPTDRFIMLNCIPGMVQPNDPLEIRINGSTERLKLREHTASVNIQINKSFINF